MIACALPDSISGINIGEALGLVGSVSERATKQLPASFADLANGIALILDGLIASAAEKRSSDDFTSARDDAFPKYCETLFALTTLARIALPESVRERAILESFSETEAHLREQGLVAFGVDVFEQAMFTVWTLRKIHELCLSIQRSDLQTDVQNKDVELRRKFALNLLWARFHLDCLIRAMHRQRPLYPAVLGEIINGLRAMVNAYALARQGLELRVPRVDQETSPVEWDDEEQALADEAGDDLVSEPA